MVITKSCDFDKYPVNDVWRKGRRTNGVNSVKDLLKYHKTDQNWLYADDEKRVQWKHYT